MENNYYIGYLRDPEQNLKDGFDEYNELEIIIKYDGNDYREITTNEKIYLANKYETIDWNKLYNQETFLVGRIGKQTSFQELRDYFANLDDNIVANYSNTLKKIYLKGKNKAINSHLEYENSLDEFAKKIKK